MVLTYLLELRQRLLIIFAVYIGFFILCFVYRDSLYYTITKPLLLALPVTSTLIATRLISPVLIPFNLAADIALLATLPIALWQLWRFIMPALYQKERQLAYGLTLSSLIMLGLGMLFCFYIVLPNLFNLFVRALPANVRFMPDMGYALDFIIRMLVIFGLSFQLPLLCMLSIKLKWLTIKQLQLIRPYFIVAAFIIGMLLTPPDVLSQLMLAIPLCLLFELGVFFAGSIKI